jgi:hypothetical protein
MIKPEGKYRRHNLTDTATNSRGRKPIELKKMTREYSIHLQKMCMAMLSRKARDFKMKQLASMDPQDNHNGR